MANRIFRKPQLNLSKHNERPFFVDMEAFFEFSFWIAEELTDLIAQQQFEEASKSKQLNTFTAKEFSATNSIRN